MKEPNIVRQSISATNVTLASLGFHNEGFRTNSSPSENSNIIKTVVPDHQEKIEGSVDISGCAL